jgi:hypothetical protein
MLQKIVDPLFARIERLGLMHKKNNILKKHNIVGDCGNQLNLCQLVIVMRKFEIHATRVDVHRFAKQFALHCNNLEKVGFVFRNNTIDI